MNFAMFKLRAPWAAVAALALSAPLSHAASTWNLGGSNCTTSDTTGYGNTYSCTAGAGTPTITATAWSTTGSGSTFATANLAQYSGGFGVRNQSGAADSTSPDHSMDNHGATDTILLNFAQSVALNQLTIGWMQTDSDISVLRYTGSGTPVVAGKSIANLLTSGWSLVGDYADLQTGTARTITSGTSVTSSWWLISAYNSGYGGGNSYTGGDDYVKVLSVAATVVTPPPPGRTPEPGSLALAGLALACVGSLRARRNS